MFYQIKRKELLEFHPLSDVSIGIGTIELKAKYKKFKSLNLVADPLHAITAVSLWPIDITGPLVVQFISTSRAVPAGAGLGPCALTHTSLCDSIAFIACKSSDRRETAFVLQMDPSASSECLQMIQSARNAEEQNLEAYKKNGHLFFRAFKDIPEDTELLVWYGRDLTKLLGLSTEQKNTKGFICSECKQRFLSEFPLLAHKRFFCIKKPASFLKELAVPEMYSVSSKPTTNFHNLAREQENCTKNRPGDAKSPKRRQSLEADTDESDGEPNLLTPMEMKSTTATKSAFTTRIDVPGHLPAKSLSVRARILHAANHNAMTTDPDNQDLKSSTTATKSAFTTRVSKDVQGDENKKSAFMQPPHTMPDIPLMSTSFTSDLIPNRTSVLPAILPLNFHSSALLNMDLPKQLALLPSANIWSRTSQLQRPQATRLQSLLTHSLGLPIQNWCAKCNLSFQMTSDLVQHMRSNERQSRVRDERLKCPICNTSHT
uniref:Si:dkeyp-41f9.4 n=1 Tax=Sinocyclocheilus grahami TaxID=75366 RepID=A0A672L4U4_SINGR